MAVVFRGNKEGCKTALFVVLSLQLRQHRLDFFQKFTDLQVLGTFPFAVAAINAILGSCAGFLFIVDIAGVGLLSQFMQTVYVVISICLEDFGYFNTLRAGLTVTATGTVQLRELP